MNCDTCQHALVVPSEEPCFSCRWHHKTDQGSNWEPVRMSIDDCTPEEWNDSTQIGVKIDGSLAQSGVLARHDQVNKPDHYTFSRIECLDYIQDVLSRVEYIGFLRGQVIKYQHRLTRKGDPAENAEKLAFYANRLAAALGDA